MTFLKYVSLLALVCLSQTGFAAAQSCVENSDCGNKFMMCMNGKCQKMPVCKASSACTDQDQACISGHCQANACSKNNDCTDKMQSCQDGQCMTQTVASCRSNSICTQGGMMDDKRCVNGKCGCLSASDCGSRHVCSNGSCVSSKCMEETAAMDCRTEVTGQVCSPKGFCTTQSNG